MIQNLIALTIVFLAIGITIFLTIKSLMAKKASNCDGCSGCSFKELPAPKFAKAKHNNKPNNGVSLNQKKLEAKP